MKKILSYLLIITTILCFSMDGLAQSAARKIFFSGRTSITPTPPPSATQQYDFLSASLPAGLTFTRATSATDIIGGTLTSFSSGAARISTTNGLLIEEQRTNISTYSGDYGWQSTLTNGQTDPLGGSAAKLLLINTANNNHGWEKSGYTISGSAYYTFSMMIKSGTATRAQLSGSYNWTNSDTYINIDLSGGTITQSAGAATNAFIVPMSGGWYRVGYTFLTTSSPSSGSYGVYFITGPTTSRKPSFAGNGTDSFFIYGQQLEAGSFATSLIPTTTASATRNADQITVITPNFLNDSEGSFSVSGTSGNGINSTGSDTATLRIDDGTDNNLHAIRQAAATKALYGTTLSGASSQASISGSTLSARTAFKAAYGYKLDDFAFASLGTFSGVDLSGTVPSSLSAMRIGASTSSSGFCNCYIKNIKYWNTRLTNSEVLGAVQ